MKTKYYKGFSVYNFGSQNLVFVALHPTTSLRILPRGDVGADLLSLRLANVFGGTSIISFIPRDQEWGLDFNRLAPSRRIAFRGYKYYKDGIEEEFFKFKKRYSWIARNENEHRQKESIYRNFWNCVEKFSNRDSLILFIHVQDLSLRNYPSLVDVIPLKGFAEEKVKDLIENLNRRFSRIFKEIKKDFLECLLFNEKHLFRSFVLQKARHFKKGLFRGDLKEIYMKTMKRLEYLGFAPLRRELELKFSLENYLKVVREVVKRVPLRITYKLNFDGSLAYGSKMFLRKRKFGLELEVSVFLSEIYTNLGVLILSELVKSIKTIL